MYTLAARPGLILMDATLNIVASNSEALQILAFPVTDPQITESQALAAQRIRAHLQQYLPLNGALVIPQFRSGMRTYLCHSFPVQLLGETPARRAYILMLERRMMNSMTLEEIGARFNLTPREQQVIHYLAQGFTSKEIACRMAISTHTVKAFLRLVMMKMNVSTRSGIIGKIVDAGAHEL